MRGFIFIFLALVFYSVSAQDKLYYLNGTTKTCVVESITDSYLFIKIGEVEQTVSKYDLLLVEFKNGTVEVINLPKENVIVNPVFVANPDAIPNEGAFKQNYTSLNTLALCNADISAFYEYVPKNKPFGFGVMGAYNFNLHTGFQNNFLSRLSNAKKNYDMGVTLNVYPFEYSDDLQIYFGMMIKYTDFNFDKIKIDSVSTPGGTQQTVTYSPAHGYQLATIFTAGTHTYLNDQFYIRTIGGLGAFRLNGDYKQQFNLEVNKRNTGGQNANYNYLPKIYLGINIGFNF